MPILLPTALLATAVVLDLVDLATATSAFAVPAYWILAGGVAAGLMTGPLVLIGWLQLPSRSPARRLGSLRGGCITLVLLLFLGSWLLRDAQGGVPLAALVLSFVAAVVSILTPCLGALLVRRTAVGSQATRGDGSRAADAPSRMPSSGVR